MGTGSASRGVPVPPVPVRRATLDDVASVAALLDAYFRDFDIWERDSQENLTRNIGAPQLGCYLAEAHGRALGCVFGHPCPNLPGAAECKRLFVLPEARGRGLAIRLMQALEEEARTAGFGWLYLDSKDEFAAAIALYRKAGYTPCERYNDNRQATQFFRKALR